MKVSIIGAGIAGLTTAIALNKIGIKTTIFESKPTIKAVGAGLVLAGNAIKAFQVLGIANEVIKLGLLLPSFTIYDQKGKTISKIDSKVINKKYGVGNFSIHRSETEIIFDGVIEVFLVRVLFCLDEIDGSLYACKVPHVLHFTLAICLTSFIATMVWPRFSLHLVQYESTSLPTVS